jgi:ribosomal protein L20
MKKLIVALLITMLFAIGAFAQSQTAPTLRIVAEDPTLPADLYYGNIKVKPLRMRPGSNPAVAITIDDFDFFVFQQYVDFLRRFPEPSGLQFYMNILNGCNNDAACLKYSKVEVSANFFRSPEFQIKGVFVHNFYAVSYGSRISSPVVEQPTYSAFTQDLQAVTGANDSDTEAKKVAFANAWVQRPEFLARYGSLTNAQFIDKLAQTAGVTLANRDALVSDLDAARKTRAQALRAVVESPEVTARFYKPAFVYMQYAGYLRRDPEIDGFNFHINRFNITNDPHTMVDGFIYSPEYRDRF